MSEWVLLYSPVVELLTVVDVRVGVVVLTCHETLDSSGY